MGDGGQVLLDLADWLEFHLLLHVGSCYNNINLNNELRFFQPGHAGRFGHRILQAVEIVSNSLARFFDSKLMLLDPQKTGQIELGKILWILSASNLRPDGRQKIMKNCKIECTGVMM